MTTSVAGTPRTTEHRVPKTAVTEVQAVYDILDAGLVAHVACVVDGQPYVLPVGYARDGDRVLFHGSAASRLFRVLAAGQPTCFEVTLLDGLVLARSAFESSMNYRSVMALGTCVVLEGQKKEDALLRITEHLLPGRDGDARRTTPKESAATTVLALSLAECSCKVSDKHPEDDPADLVDPHHGNVWAGYVPIREVFGEPVADPQTVERNIPVPDYVRAWSR